jgi:hypothetical protein
MTELEYLDRTLRQKEKELKRMNSRWRKLWRNTVVHWGNLAFFRLWPTWMQNAHSWLRRGGDPQMCWVPNCGHPATEFGQCSYHFAGTRSDFRDRVEAAR